MDLIIRNARMLQGSELRLVDIGIHGTTIAAVSEALQADAQEIDTADGACQAISRGGRHIDFDTLKRLTSML